MLVERRDCLNGRTFTGWHDGRRSAPLQPPPNAREQRATEGSSGPLFLRLGGRLSLCPFHSALAKYLSRQSRNVLAKYLSKYLAKYLLGPNRKFLLPAK